MALWRAGAHFVAAGEVKLKVPSRDYRGGTRIRSLIGVYFGDYFRGPLIPSERLRNNGANISFPLVGCSFLVT